METMLVLTFSLQLSLAPDTGGQSARIYYGAESVRVSGASVADEECQVPDQGRVL